MSRSALRWGAVLGLAHIVALLTGFAVEMAWNGPHPAPGATPEVVADAYAAAPLAQVFAGGYLEVWGLLLFLPFAAALAAHLRRAEGPDGFGSTTVLLAAVVFTALSVAPGMSAGAAALELAQRRDAAPGVVDALNTLRAETYYLALLSYALFFAVVAVLALRRAALPAWLGWWAAGVAAALALGVASGTEVADAAAFLGFGWVVALCVRWLRLARRSDAEVAGAPAAAGVPAARA